MLYLVATFHVSPYLVLSVLGSIEHGPCHPFPMYLHVNKAFILLKEYPYKKPVSTNSSKILDIEKKSSVLRKASLFRHFHRRQPPTLQDAMQRTEALKRTDPQPIFPVK
jgi:hypothetical protein